MDCDDVMLALANRARTLTAKEGAKFHAHLEDCDECRAVAEESTTEWRWLARLPQDAFDSDGDVALALPMVDPIVFDIDQEIAQGGMGRITKAMDRRLGRDVAVKEVLEAGLRARFEREAMITARLQHPAIVPIYEAGTFPNGNPFYTMRLVWGGTLGAAIHKTRSTAERLALLPHVLAVVDALAYAHDNRIIHRDLKPGNVLIGEFGETVVIDWGLAKELDSKIEDATGESPSARRPVPKLTRVGSVMGTPGFMSPEQASGGILDERADVYALGSILYNLLAGVPPYWDKHGTEGSTQLIALGLARPPTPIAELAPDAPPDLRVICEKAMARNKADRYPSAKEMAAELRRFSAGQLISREYRLRELFARWVKKHRTVVAISSIAAIALAVVAVLAFVNVSRARRVEEEQKTKALAAEALAQEGVASLLEEQGLRELAAGDSNRALTYLAGAYERLDTPALRYLLAAATDDLDKQHDTLPGAAAIAFAGDQVITVEDMRVSFWNGTTLVRSFAIGTEPVLAARFDEAARYVALRRALPNHAARLELWDIVGSTRLWESPERPMDAALPVFDGAGKRSANHVGDKIVVRDLAPAGVSTTIDAGIAIVDVAIGDAHVAACATDGAILVWSLGAFDKPLRRLRPRNANCQKLVFLEAATLVVANKKHELLLWPIEKDAPDSTMSSHMKINTISINAAKKKIATGDATGVVMWSWKGDALGESREVPGGIDKLGFSPDGESMVGAGADDRVFVWDTESFHLRRATSGGEGSVRGIAISKDRLATVGEGKTNVWAMPGGRLVSRALTPAPSPGPSSNALDTAIGTLALDAAPVAGRGDLSPDGQLVALVFESSIQVWDLARRERIASIAVPAWHSYGVRFDPTSTRLVLLGGTEPALLVEARSGTTIATLELARSVDGVAFSKDGSRIALGIGNTVQLWTTKEPGRPLFTVSSTPKSSYALSDDGELFATGSLDGQIRIWDSRGRMLDRLVGSQTAITRVEFSGDRLLGQSDDGFSTTWDVHRDKRTRAEIKEFAEKYSNWRLVNVQIVPKL